MLAARARASVVLINEAHNQPDHRAYCRQLLRQLAPLGYRYCAVEALYPTETAINARKFPLSCLSKRCLAQLYDQAEYAQYGEKDIPLDQYLTSPLQKQVYLFGFLPNRPVLIKYRPTGSI